MESLFSKDIYAVIIALAGSIFISWLSVPLVVKVTVTRHLTDPPGHRKVHKRAVPTLGGVALFAGFTFGFLMAVNGFMHGVNYFILATLVLFFAGMKDDLITLDPRKKLVGEVLAAILLLYFTDIRITDFHGFLGIHALPVWLTYVTTIFIMIVIINALNLIDGIDGLAAATGMIASAAFAIWFWLSGNTGYTIMSVALAGALAGFIWFNLSDGKNKIFMGDTGSLLVGFILAVLTILFNEVNAGTSPYHDLTSAPAISIAILIVPLFDTLRVFTIRILRGQHPFTADNRHIHHMMLRAGFSHKRAVLFISISHILIIALAFLIDHIGIVWLSVVLLSVCLMLTGVIYILVYLQTFPSNLPVRDEDFEMICLISGLHGMIDRKRNISPVGIRCESGNLIAKEKVVVPKGKKKRFSVEEIENE